MRWLAAGLAFAVLVALAVATVAVKVGNLRARARLEAVGHRVDAHVIECTRREHALRGELSAAGLRRRWQRLLSATDRGRT